MPSNGSAARARPTTAGDDLQAIRDQQRLLEFRDLFEAKNYAYIIPSAEALLGRPNLDPITKLEICYLLSECYLNVGETAKAAETMKRYDQLRQEYVEGAAGKEQKGLKEAVQRFVSDLRRRHLVSIAKDEQQRQNEVLKAKLDAAAAGSVLEIEADSGGKIVASTDEKALAARLSEMHAGGAAAVVQHDLEFDYYYAIQEDPPPQGPPGGAR